MKAEMTTRAKAAMRRSAHLLRAAGGLIGLIGLFLVYLAVAIAGTATARLPLSGLSTAQTPHAEHHVLPFHAPKLAADEDHGDTALPGAGNADSPVVGGRHPQLIAALPASMHPGAASLRLKAAVLHLSPARGPPAL